MSLPAHHTVTTRPERIAVALRFCLPLAGLLLLTACKAPAPAAPPGANILENQRRAAELAMRAEKALQAGQWKQAADLNREAVRLEPFLGGAWANLGVALMYLGEKLEAKQCLLRAAEVSPNDPRPYENLGLLELESGWPEEALHFYELSLERQPYHLPSLRGAIQAAKSLNRSTEEGLDRIRRALLVEKDPAWLRLFESERSRVSQDLADQKQREARGR
jgi:tetratricopeptide (TPR) repeat protein